MIFTPTYSDVLKAQTRLNGHAIRTPILRSDKIDALVGCKTGLKAEPLQKGGAFKYRGARNRLSQLSQEEAQCGVVAFSSGNHAIGVAISARELGIPAIIVMPSDAPQVKVDTVLNNKADIQFYDRLTENREEIAASISLETGRVIVPSYDDPHIISGQGTIGLELVEQCPDMTSVIVCMGGGGMCAGIGLAIKHHNPDIKIYGAEPEAYNDHQQSFEAGKRVALETTPPTLCDALMTPKPGEITWEINSKNLSGVFTVSDTDCLKTMALVKRELDVTLEPGGAVALASLIKYKPFGPEESIIAIGSGGNVDADIMKRALSVS